LLFSGGVCRLSLYDTAFIQWKQYPDKKDYFPELVLVFFGE